MNDNRRTVRRDIGCAFLGGPVHLRWQRLVVPVQLLRGIGVVVDIDHHRLALGEPQQWAREPL
ncbi:hypothetical protein AB0L63_29985 [Nocardia sp. NPDC051990]|uniref:hypothetical protein n=1 Tax=Nocardia sp. NPDC051990 TaxID=3155285 RepID=UPI0034146CA4